MADKVLSEEVERLQKLKHEGHLGSSKLRVTDNEQLSTPDDAQIESRELSDISTRSRNRKRIRHSGSDTDVDTPQGRGYDTAMQRESAKDSRMEAVTSGAFFNNQQVYLVTLHMVILEQKL